MCCMSAVDCGQASLIPWGMCHVPFIHPHRACWSCQGQSTEAWRYSHVCVLSNWSHVVQIICGVVFVCTLLVCKYFCPAVDAREAAETLAIVQQAFHISRTAQKVFCACRKRVEFWAVLLDSYGGWLFLSDGHENCLLHVRPRQVACKISRKYACWTLHSWSLSCSHHRRWKALLVTHYSVVK